MIAKIYKCQWFKKHNNKKNKNLDKYDSKDSRYIPFLFFCFFSKRDKPVIRFWQKNKKYNISYIYPKNC